MYLSCLHLNISLLTALLLCTSNSSIISLHLVFPIGYSFPLTLSLCGLLAVLFVVHVQTTLVSCYYILLVHHGMNLS